MAKIPMYDPLTSEARSPLIAGLTEACNKLSSILDLHTEEAYDMPLSPIYVSEDDKYRLWQAPLGNKLWLEYPAPIIRKNGIVITPEIDEFTIDYFGGSIAFDNNKQLSEFDTVTADFTFIVDRSHTIDLLIEEIEAVGLNANKFRGYYNDVTSAISTVTNPVGGDYFIVGGEENNIYIWNSETRKWEPVHKKTDLSNYYTKPETDNLLNEKEDVITPHGNSLVSDDYYYGGRKTWININEKVQGVPLTGIDTTNTGKVNGTDTVLSSIGKLQGQIDNYVHDLFGTSNPTTTTVGKVGQDYTNTSTGDKFHLVEIDSSGNYIWESYSNSTEMNNVKNQLNNAISEIERLDNEKVNKVSPATPGHLVILDTNGNIIDSGKGVDDVGKGPQLREVTLLANRWNGPFDSARLVYGKDKFVATANTIAERNFTFYGTDGIHWNKSSIFPDNAEASLDICYGSNKFVCSTINAILYSTDGLTWNKANTPTSINVSTNLIGGEGKFFAWWKEAGSFIYSTDGINWSNSNISISNDFNISNTATCYVNNRFFIVCCDKNSLTIRENRQWTIYYSNDGLNWNSYETTHYIIDSIVYANNKYYMLCTDVSDVLSREITQKIMISTDGFNWSELCNTVDPTTGTPNYFYERLYFLNGNFFVDSQIGIYKSTDCINFTQVHTFDRYLTHTITYGGGRYVGVGPYFTVVSTNGENWTETHYSDSITQTVPVEGAIANESKQIVRVSPDPFQSNISQIMDCGVYCTAQGEGTLTFTAFDDKPSEDVVFNVELQDL